MFKIAVVSTGNIGATSTVRIRDLANLKNTALLIMVLTAVTLMFTLMSCGKDDSTPTLNSEPKSTRVDTIFTYQNMTNLDMVESMLADAKKAIPRLTRDVTGEIFRLKNENTPE
jgi:hypothetical protein